MVHNDVDVAAFLIFFLMRLYLRGLHDDEDGVDQDDRVDEVLEHHVLDYAHQPPEVPGRVGRRQPDGRTKIPMARMHGGSKSSAVSSWSRRS